jgi:NAD(P)-dependent dehydrogenase (short-subunit alcohol dehydrogenase family)
MKPIASYCDFTDKVVVITGGSRGIGYAMALPFAAAGAKVAVAGRKIESCEATVKEIRALGSDGSAHRVHVGNWKDCDRLADEVYAKWGRADVWINNAGLSPLAPSSLETSEELFDKIIAVNLKRAVPPDGALRLAYGSGRRRRNYQRLVDFINPPKNPPKPRNGARRRGQGRAQHSEDRIRDANTGPRCASIASCAGPPHRYKQGMVAHGRFDPAREGNVSVAARRRTRRSGRRGNVLREFRGELHHRCRTDGRRCSSNPMVRTVYES